MNETVRVGDRTWYLEGFAATGFYLRNENEVYIVDAGNTEESGGKIERILDDRGWTPAGILLTHAHTDHYGGCAYLQKRYGCPVFAKGCEAYIAEKSFLEPAIFYGGYPYPELTRRGIYYSDGCRCLDVTSELFPSEVEVIDLAGHSMESVGYLMPDGTAFIGDAVFDEQTAEKYPLQSIYSIDDELESFETLKRINARKFVTGHGGVIDDICRVCDTDRKTVLEVGQLILDITEKPMTTEEITAELIRFYNIGCSFRTHALILSIARTYISWHREKGRIDAVFEDGFLRWRRIR